MSIGGGPSTTYSLTTNVRISSNVSRSISANASLTLLASSRKSGRVGMGLLERGSVEIRAGQIAADEPRPREIRAAKIDAAQVAAHEDCTAQVRAVHVRSLEIDVEQRRARPVRTRQRHRRVLVPFEHALEQHCVREVCRVQLAVLERRVLNARAMEPHPRHAHGAQLAAED